MRVGDFVMTGAAESEIWPLVRDFHYSERSPSAVRHAFAVRRPGGLFGDTGEAIAGLTYSQPVSKFFDPRAVELSRLVRCDGYDGPSLSQFVCWTLRWLRANTPTPFVLSYADSTQGHHGGIYQACNFVYVGAVDSGHIGYACPDGSFVHRRSCNTRFGTSSMEAMASIRPEWLPVHGEEKHLYIFPLRERWAKLSKRCGWSQQTYPKPDRQESEAA
jgi:hypothetical protein